MDHLTRSWARLSTQARLSLEDVISVAEQAMERGGLVGKKITVPEGHVDDPAYQTAIAPLNEYVRAVTGKPWLRLYTSAYTLKQEGNPRAVTDGMNWIVTRPQTNEMTILHECAHVILGTGEHRGHTRAFAETARDLYAKYISAEAAQTFWNLVELSGE